MWLTIVIQNSWHLNLIKNMFITKKIKKNCFIFLIETFFFKLILKIIILKKNDNTIL